MSPIVSGMASSLTQRAERPAAPRELEPRAVAALLSCVARQGLRKTTLEDVAREAGCGRATLYRHFARKQALLSTPVAPVSLDDVAAVRGYTREFIVPALDPLSTRSSAPTRR